MFQGEESILVLGEEEGMCRDLPSSCVWVCRPFLFITNYLFSVSQKKKKESKKEKGELQKTLISLSIHFSSSPTSKHFFPVP